MSKTTEEIIKNIQGLIKEYEDHSETFYKLVDKQEEAIRELIERYKPVYEWIRNQTSYTFTHPALEYRNHTGPILGYQEDDHRLIIYDVKEEAIKITDIGEKHNDDKIIPIHYLVREGYFVTAVEGLKFLEDMFDRYVTGIADKVVKLDEQLNKISQYQ